MSNAKNGYLRGATAKALAVIGAASGLRTPQFRVIPGTRSYQPSGETLDMSKTIFETHYYQTWDGVKTLTEYRPKKGPGVNIFMHNIPLRGGTLFPVRIPGANLDQALENYEAAVAPVMARIEAQYRAIEATAARDVAEAQRRFDEVK